ncbi:MAG: hypothetical protein P8Q99_03035 [Paracoccaceae bacterium]|nr:hypothetical protein [Paracoccaceae bacterium]
MSAFFVGAKTIHAAATLILMGEGPRSAEDINKIGRSLWMMNALALEERYADENAQSYLDQINGYQFAHVEGVDFASILKATNCLLYQCSEGEVPQMSLFKKLKAITDRYADTEETDAYDKAPLSGMHALSSNA